MTLNHYLQPRKRVPLKAALRRMRAIWLKGPVDHFDRKLAKILDYNLEDAAKIREEWESMGFLAYDQRGLLTWKIGAF